MRTSQKGFLLLKPWNACENQSSPSAAAMVVVVEGRRRRWMPSQVTFVCSLRLTMVLEDSFELYDLRVSVVCPPGQRILCGAKDGDYFTLEGELLRLPPGQGFSIYSLGELVRSMVSNTLTSSFFPGAILPLLSGYQRTHSANDWMATDAEVACPDPHCPSRLRITKTGKRTFSHGETTVVPLNNNSL